MRYAQIVMGPAGSGKSTYCSNIVKHCETLKRTVHVVNLDPAAEHFDYPVLADIRDLICVDDVMEDEDLHMGPNGGLVFCMEHFAQNFDWLQEAIDDIEDDYLLFDCPGQIELYTHIPVMRQFVDHLRSSNFYICGVFVIDAQFLVDASKFASGVLSALSAMVNLEIPHVNVMSKLDLLNKQAKQQIEKFLEPDMMSLLADEMDDNGDNPLSVRFHKLNQAIATLIEDYSLVKFLPLDITDEESINDILIQIDNAIQYGEDLEPKEPKDMYSDDVDDHNNENYEDT
jgi:hypothetical protein